MYVDTNEPWAHMSTPETDADLNLRKEFEHTLEDLCTMANRLEIIREQWFQWRDGFRSE